MSEHKQVAEWRKKLNGRKIVDVRHLTQEEAKAAGWYSRPPVLQLDDGSLLIAQRDDEGNDGGVIFFQGSTEKDDEVLFVVRD